MASFYINHHSSEHIQVEKVENYVRFSSDTVSALLKPAEAVQLAADLMEAADALLIAENADLDAMPREIPA